MINMSEKTFDNEKFKEAVKSLEDVSPENMDFAEVLGVVVDDIADMYRANDSKKFIKEKSDARRSLKILLRKLNNMTYKTFKK